MRFYSQYIFPFVLDKVMQKEVFTKKRKQLLHSVSGKVLEIGVGTGLNFEFYPNSIKEISTVDVNPRLNQKALRRATLHGITCKHKVVSAETLPFKDNTFDYVVSTWTLCSIPNVTQALSEIRRVLKPGGRFVFIEHGAHKDKIILKWQNRLTPLWKKVGDGCHLNRDIKKLIEKAPLTLDNYSEYEVLEMRHIVGYLYEGIARK